MIADYKPLPNRELPLKPKFIEEKDKYLLDKIQVGFIPHFQIIAQTQIYGNILISIG